MKLFKKILLTTLVILVGCTSKEQVKRKINFKPYLQQKIDYRDSLYVLHTVKEWQKADFIFFTNYQKYYKTKNILPKHEVSAVFYSPNRKQMLVWVLEKIPNYDSKIGYIPNYVEYKSEKDSVYLKLADTDKDTMYNMYPIFGRRDKVDEPWQLCPFIDMTLKNYDSKEDLMLKLSEYFLDEMKDAETDYVVQSGKDKGILAFRRYGYHLRNSKFWNGWMFQKDNIGSKGMYFYEIDDYWTKNGYVNKSSAQPFMFPKIKYPSEILKMYNRKLK